MSDLLRGDGVVGFVIPVNPDDPFLVKEWDTDGQLIRIQERRLRKGEQNPFSSDEADDDIERERLFWERTVKVSDTHHRLETTPTWVKILFVGSMILNPAVWITVGWKLYREKGGRSR